METKAKTKSIFLKMLVALIIVATLIAGVFMAIPKAGEVHAAEPGSSATLAGYVNNIASSWYNKLSDPITKANIASILITTDSSAIQGFTQGENIKDSTSQNDLYYYYKVNEQDSTLYELVIYADVETIYAPKNSTDLFNSLTCCESIILDNFDTTLATNISCMFRNCTLLTTLDFGDNFDTKNVTAMDNMFYNCSSLSSLNLSSFDTSQVTNMRWMFANCSSLTSLNLSSFDTSQVTAMDNMFANCSLLTNLSIGDNFDTKNVTNMSNMFDGCSSLSTNQMQNIVNKLNTSSVTDMSSMFYGCSSLTSLNLSGFNTSLVSNMSSMFTNCALTELDISGFSFQSITDASGVELMFGMSHAQVAQMMGMEDMGISIEDYINATNEEKLAMLTGLGVPEEGAVDIIAMGGNPIPKIIAPADLNGLSIALPGEYEYIEGDTQTTSVLVAGATHTLPGYVEPENPTLPESGVTMLDLVILTILTLTISGVSLMLLKRKKFN